MQAMDHKIQIFRWEPDQDNKLSPSKWVQMFYRGDHFMKNPRQIGYMDVGDGCWRREFWVTN